MLGRNLKMPLSNQLGRIRHFIFHSLLHADDPPHQLALGVAVGMFITFTPTPGFQMALVVFTAWLLRANKVVGLPLVWISNPFTTVPIFYPCYLVGRIMLGREPMGAEWWSDLSTPPSGWWPTATFYWERFLDIFTPLWLGCLVVATALAVPTYYVVYFTIRTYRLRRWGQLTPPESQ